MTKKSLKKLERIARKKFIKSLFENNENCKRSKSNFDYDYNYTYTYSYFPKDKKKKSYQILTFAFLEGYYQLMFVCWKVLLLIFIDYLSLTKLIIQF